MPIDALHRRNVLLGAGAAGVAAAGFGSTADARVAPHKLEARLLRRFLGTRFDTYLEDGSVRHLRLRAVKDDCCSEGRPRSLSRKSTFTAVFEANGPMLEGIHRLSHRRLGPLLLFLQPADENSLRPRYLAVFN